MLKGYLWNYLEHCEAALFLKVCILFSVDYLKKDFI